MKIQPSYHSSRSSTVWATSALLLLLLPTISCTPLDINASVPLAENNVHCTSSIDWLLPVWRPQDCIGAFNAFQYSDYGRYGMQRFEFRNRGTPSRTRPKIKQMLTPKRYAIGHCTIAIAMLAAIDWPLPDEPETEYAPTDVASFREIFESVRRLEVGCVNSAQPCGWEPVGREGSVGVLLFATDSPVDMAIQGRLGGGSLLNLTQTGNTSVLSRLKSGLDSA